MNRSRRAAYDARTGGTRPSRRAPGTEPAGPSAASTYELLAPRLAGLRAELAASGSGAAPLADRQRASFDLDHLLAEAVAQAFAADAVGAAPPRAATSWVAEGLARCEERERALLAAADVSGVVQMSTAAGPRW